MKRRSLARRLADHAEMAAAGAFAALARSLPGTGWAGRVGAFALPRLPVARKRVAANLRHVRPEATEAEIRDLCAGVGDQLGRLAVEHLRLPDIAQDPSRIVIEEDGSLRDALATGRGVVLASAHFGNWEALRIAVRQATGRDCALARRAFNNPVIDAWVRRMIAPAGTPLFHRGREGTRALVRHVAGGGVAMILVDQRQTGAPLIPFLGQPSETATSAAALALRFEAALIPARARRLADGRFSVRFEPEIPPATAQDMMAEVNARIGVWVEEAPEQWFWLHRRWRHRGERGERIRAARQGL